jgi:hypothetical protein
LLFSEIIYLKPARILKSVVFAVLKKLKMKILENLGWFKKNSKNSIDKISYFLAGKTHLKNL